MQLLILAVAGLAFQASHRSAPPRESLVPSVTFGGSGQNSIAAMQSDAAGNLYVAGATTSVNFPVRHAAQSRFGESELLSSADRGNTWTKLNPPPQMPLWIEPDPIVATILFAGTTAGIYRSTDGGGTWSSVYPWQMPVGVTAGMAIDPGNHLHMIATAISGLVILSTDGGATWSAANLPNAYYSAPVWPQYDPFGSGAILINGASQFLSTDGGRTFTELAPPDGGVRVGAFDTVHRGWLWDGIGHGILGHLYLSMDSGATWTTKPDAPSAIHWLTIDPELPQTLYADTLEGLYVSNDGAATWTNMKVPGGFSLTGRPVFQSRKCAAGGGLFVIANNRLESSQDFSTWQAAPFAGAVDLSAGPGCQVYAARTLSTDAFVAKLAPGGKEAVWVTYLGGLGADAASALAVDASGNVYVAGTTSSLDFPSTHARLGVVGDSNMFLAKLSADGSLVSSLVFGGEATDTPTGVAADAVGNTYVVGWTDSMTFPVTAGALDTQFPANGGGGFVARFRPDSSLAYATFLNTAWPYAVVVDAHGNAVVGGGGAVPGQTPPAGKETGFLLTLDGAGASVAALAYIGGDSTQANYETTNASTRNLGPFALAADAAGNIYVEGATAAADFPVTAGAYVSAVQSTACKTGPWFAPMIPASDVYVMKLAAIGKAPVYSARLSGLCASIPRSIGVNQQGEATFTLATSANFPLMRPVDVTASCGGNSAVAGRLSADGSTLEFSTYLDACGALPLAVPPSGAFFVGASVGSAAWLVKLAAWAGETAIR